MQYGVVIINNEHFITKIQPLKIPKSKIDIFFAPYFFPHRSQTVPPEVSLVSG